MSNSIKTKNFEKILGEITPERINDNLRAKIKIGLKNKKINIQDLACECDIAQDTLREYYYSKIKTCRLSSALKIARFFNTTVEEMTGVEIVNPEIDSVITIMEQLPLYQQHYLAWVAKQLAYMNDIKDPKAKIIPVHQGICQHGNLVMGKDIEPIDISTQKESVRTKAFMGISIPCEHFMPLYSPYDTILIANDRRADYNEVVVAEANGYLWLLVRKEETMMDGKPVARYYSLREHRFVKLETEMDNIIGYVAGVHTDKRKVERWI